jgi:hypothetical protein
MSGTIAYRGLLSEPVQRKHLEDDFQMAVIRYLRWALPDDAVAWHTPNGGQRHKKAAARMVALGVRRGIPDVAVLWRGELVFFELKAPTGQLSASQRQMMDKLAYCGAHVFMARCLEHVQDRLLELGVPLQARV